MAKHRTQLFLDPEQYETLRQISEAEGCTISEVVRRFVDHGLSHRNETVEANLGILRRATEIRRSIEERHGAVQGDPVGEVRLFRGTQQESILMDVDL